MRDQRRTDPKQMELQSELKKALRQCWFSLDSKKSGGQKPWSFAAATKCAGLTSRWPDTSRTTVQFTIDGPISLYGVEVRFFPISSKDQGRVRQFRTNVVPGRSIGYALDAVRSWTGDLLRVDKEALQTISPI